LILSPLILQNTWHKTENKWRGHRCAFGLENYHNIRTVLAQRERTFVETPTISYCIADLKCTSSTGKKKKTKIS
jgi:hypothetical protein